MVHGSGNMNAKLTHALFIPSLLVEIGACLLTSRKWWDQVDKRLILGAMPFSRHVPRLHEAGVRHVINLCREYKGPVSGYRELGLTQLHLPTLDYQSPATSDVFQAIDFIERHGRPGRPVYVHCKAGRGRSATIALCWLMMARDLSASEAELRLAECRSHVNKRLGKQACVDAFKNRLNEKPNRPIAALSQD